MTKNVTFGVQDEKLIRRIEKYRQETGLPTFVAAVRKLCMDALDLKRITK